MTYDTKMRYFTILIMLALLTGIISCKKEDNQKGPVASFIVDPPEGPFTTIFLFDASETENEGEDPEDLRVRWDFNGDGIWDTDYSRNKLRNHKFDKHGNFRVVMEAVNKMGWTDTEFYEIFVYPDSIAPFAEFTVTPDSSSINTIFHFSAGPSWDIYDSITDLRFRWDFEGDSIWDTPYTCDTCVFHKYALPGSYRVVLEVRNSIMMKDKTVKEVFVYDI